jgi:hypothetical protein
MEDKVSFLKERKELADKIVLLYRTILGFEKNNLKNPRSKLKNKQRDDKQISYYR